MRGQNLRMHKYGGQVPMSRRLRKEETDAEKLLWSCLRNKQIRHVKFRRQQPIGSYIVDFVSLDKMLIVEVDGGQHDAQIIKGRDEARTSYLESKGYRVIRFWNNDVLQNLEGVQFLIEEALEQVSPSS